MEFCHTKGTNLLDMYHIRTTKTASGSTAVQVVSYVKRKVKVAKHIGSGRTEQEIQTRRKMAQIWVKRNEKQKILFDKPDQANQELIMLLSKCEYKGFRYQFIYEILTKLIDRFEFTSLGNQLLRDLVIIRIIEPASKLRSLELLGEYFGLNHRRQTFYESLPAFIKLKGKVEELAVKQAEKELAFDFTLVFYDVTTLYFETFTPDELRKTGFSKDNKSQQPQIVIGLVVSKEGFPVAYEIFPGNKFEGHTLIPIIKRFKKKQKINTLTVVADAAMISLDNIKALRKHWLNYIVGARMGNISLKNLRYVSDILNRQDKASLRIPTKYGELVADFSLKRYRKDKREMEKQIEKAKELLRNSQAVKRAKFLKNRDKNRYELNKELIDKTKLLLGIKGYYTNLDLLVSDSTVIDHYHNLWRVEQSFRVAKDDLETRPIFHFKEEPIKVHILICFMALAVSKYLEIKTARSLQQVIKTLKQVTDAQLWNTLTDQEIVMRSKIPEEVKDILKKLNLSY